MGDEKSGNIQGNTQSQNRIDPQRENQSRQEKMSKAIKIISILIIVLIIFQSFAMWFMWKYLKELSQSPLVYGAGKTSKANGDVPIACSCILNNTDKFYFDDKGIYEEDPLLTGLFKNG